MFSVTPLREEGVNLIDEYHSRLVAPGHSKQRSHHLLSFSHLQRTCIVYNSQTKQETKKFKLEVQVYQFVTNDTHTQHIVAQLTHFDVREEALILKKVAFT